jgi:dipeptidyl aminopeptidase/acylaminoacyl peptidase
MHESIPLIEKYERNGWPSLDRPELKPPAGWSLHLLAGMQRLRNHSLSPDGEQVAFIWDRDDLSEIYTLPASGGWPRRISFDRQMVPFWNDEIPRWSPDSQWLAFTMHDHVHLVPRTGGLPRKVTDFTSAASSPVWMPDSRKLIVTVERYDADQLVLTDRDGGWPRPLTDDRSGDSWDARPSPDGRYVAYVLRRFDDLTRTDIRLIDLESGNSHTVIGQAQEFNRSPRWSPDGKAMAFLSQRTDYYEIWLVQPDGSHLRQLSHFGQDVIDLEWSPDGTRLACTVNRGGEVELVLIESDSGEVRRLQGGLGVHSRPCWSPAGDFITYEHESPLSPPNLYRVQVGSGEAEALTHTLPPALEALPLVKPEIVTYKSSDGLEIPAFLFRPQKSNGAAVVDPHGGPSAQYMFDWDIFPQYLVAKGYTFLSPNYRGSTGYGRPFERLNYNAWGIGDTQDCLGAARYLRTLPGIDPARLAITGGSYGGYMTICCLSLDPEYLYACGAAEYGDSNLVSSWAQCKRELRLYTEIFLGHPAKNRQVYQDGSPLYHVENVRKPMLILHGLEDDIVPPEASEEWVAALRLHNKTFEYKTYAGEPHGFLRRANQLDAWRRIERFFDWYLLPA